MRSEEYIGSHQEALSLAMEGHTANLWTALPAIISKVDYVKQTLSAQPTIMGIHTDVDGNDTNSALPLLVDVPFQCFGGAGFVFTMPNLEGSECLIVFSSRCIDGWYQSGGVQPQAEHRTHDLSDGMALIGFNSQPNKITNYNTTAPELRTRDGVTKITLNSGNVTITSSAVTINGNLTVNGTMHSSGDTTAGSISLKSHTHTDPQGGTVGVPQ